MAVSPKGLPKALLLKQVRDARGTVVAEIWRRGTTYILAEIEGGRRRTLGIFGDTEEVEIFAAAHLRSKDSAGA